LQHLRFNTAIARLMELNTHAAKLAAAAGGPPRGLAEPLVLMVAPFAPHIADELWSRLGHAASLAYMPFPQFEESLAAEQVVTLPVQIDGKTRFRIEVPANAGKEEIAEATASHPEYARHTGGATVSRLVIVPGRIVNIVTQQ
jgi:leucyl-tRNA synthetase